MNQPNNRSRNTKKQIATPLDKFEQFCRIVDQYLRWPIQFIAVTSCCIFMEPAKAALVIPFILAVGSASAIAKLIDKWKGH